MEPIERFDIVVVGIAFKLILEIQVAGMDAHIRLSGTNAAAEAECLPCLANQLVNHESILLLITFFAGVNRQCILVDVRGYGIHDRTAVWAVNSVAEILLLAHWLFALRQ